MKSIFVKALILSSGLMGIHGVSHASDVDPYELRLARVCDITGCYLAWNVIDSDGDGYCDADELMAGSNPYDPLSRPPLRIIVELGSKALLPSFEAGQGAFLVYSTELQSKLQETLNAQIAVLGVKPLDSALTAFPMHDDQKDLLGRLGISASQLADHGIDLTRDSFAIGLDHPSDKTGIRGRKVSGIDASLISADPEDCCFPITPLINGDPGKVTFDDGNGNRITEFKDGSTLLEHANGSGEYFDKDGKLVTTFYINPDADQGSTTPTKEQIDSFERLRGATIHTIEGWSAPVTDAKPKDPHSTIVLIDPEYGFNSATMFDAPTLTTAQPEQRPDLPGVDVPADPGRVTGGCKFGCSP